MSPDETYFSSILAKPPPLVAFDAFKKVRLVSISSGAHLQLINCALTTD